MNDTTVLIISFVILNVCTGIIAYKMAVNRMSKVMELIPIGTVSRLQRSVDLAHTKINDLLDDLAEEARLITEIDADLEEIQGTTIEEMVSANQEVIRRTTQGIGSAQWE